MHVGVGDLDGDFGAAEGVLDKRHAVWGHKHVDGVTGRKNVLQNLDLQHAQQVHTEMVIVGR